jgi:hypothetical protein
MFVAKNTAKRFVVWRAGVTEGQISEPVGHVIDPNRNGEIRA